MQALINAAVRLPQVQPTGNQTQIDAQSRMIGVPPCCCDFGGWLWPCCCAGLDVPPCWLGPPNGLGFEVVICLLRSFLAALRRLFTLRARCGH